MDKRFETCFAPAERASDEMVRDEVADILKQDWVRQVYDSLDEILMILNEQRQLVFANRPLQALLGLETLDAVYGKRPGEVLHCQYADNETGGCGTSRHCRQCGAVNAILASRHSNAREVRECHIIQKGTSEALTLRVVASPLILHDHHFTILAIQDISDHHRRRVLERIFFHDIMNTAVGLRGLSMLLAMAEPGEMDDLQRRISIGTDELVRELESQRNLNAVENKEYNPEFTDTSVKTVLDELEALYRDHPETTKRNLVILFPPEDIPFKTDPALLFRVLSNMTKNALEATPSEGTVTVSGVADSDTVYFKVNNPGVMPEAVQLQIFQRAFSTKGPSRGLGTYSMKLISERYLGGWISFASNEEMGTTFIAAYPRHLNPDDLAVPAGEVAPEQAPSESAGQRALSVMLAEDNKVNALVGSRMIEEIGHTCVTAPDGQAVLDMLRDTPVDVILMDVQMPRMDGLAATQAIRNQSIKQPYIIGLTADASTEARDHCLNAGMNDYLTKPINPEKLRDTLKRVP
ncbi:MAG: response regulator [Spartobacteria bacterium]|nr:response regulator [Spartobacteria bacterium]